VTPKFCKQYAQVGELIQGALQRYKDDVSAGLFPGRQYSPYRIPKAEVDVLVRELRQRGMDRVAEAVEQYEGEKQQQAQQ
jgi:3-methyl-2-oxobutanoate hydroxymethyltransferase